jgi:hypothetical protein
MDAGGEPAWVFVAHGAAPGVYTVTNHIGSIMGPFDLTLDNLEGGKPYWLTMVATNSVGRYEMPATIFGTRGDDITDLTRDGVGAVTAPDTAAPRLGHVAFDNVWDDLNRWFETLSLVTFPIPITYTFQKKMVPTGYGIHGNNQFTDRQPKTWRLEGSNGDKITGPWTLLDRRENQPAWPEGVWGSRFFGVASTEGFIHWRLSLEELHSHANMYSQVMEIEYFGYPDVSDPPQPVALPVEILGNGAVNIKGGFAMGGGVAAFSRRVYLRGAGNTVDVEDGVLTTVPAGAEGFVMVGFGMANSNNTLRVGANGLVDARMVRLTAPHGVLDVDGGVVTNAHIRFETALIGGATCTTGNDGRVLVRNGGRVLHTASGGLEWAYVYYSINHDSTVYRSTVEVAGTGSLMDLRGKPVTVGDNRAGSESTGNVLAAMDNGKITGVTALTVGHSAAGNTNNTVRLGNGGAVECETLTVNSENGLEAVVTADGTGVITVSGAVAFNGATFVRPFAERGALAGSHLIVDARGSSAAFATDGLDLEEGVDRSRWALDIDPVAKTVKLRHKSPGTLLMVR